MVLKRPSHRPSGLFGHFETAMAVETANGFKTASNTSTPRFLDQEALYTKKALLKSQNVQNYEIKVYKSSDLG